MSVSRIWIRGGGLLLAMVFMASGVAWGGGGKWVLLDSDPDHSDFYYDKDAIKRLPEGIIGIQAKVVFSPKGKADALESLKNAAYRDLTWALYQYELNCDTQQSRLVRVVNYDSKESVITEFKLAGKTKWEDVPSGSRLEMVQEQECPQQK